MVNTAEKFTALADKEKQNGEKTPPPANPDKPKVIEVDKKLRELEDPLCSPNNVQHITFQDVTTASFLIKGGVEYTPCSVTIWNYSEPKPYNKMSRFKKSQLSGQLGMNIFLKKEFLQYTGRYGVNVFWSR